MTEMLLVAKSDWVSKPAELKWQGFARCEWLTATHNGGSNFDITICVSKVDLGDRTLISTVTDDDMDSLIGIYPIAAFHEREVAQMFGITFTGHDTSELAFETQVDGFPLRRDFFLSN